MLTICRSLLLLVLGVFLALQPAAVLAGAGDLETRVLLKGNWEGYKATFIQADGRVIDYNGNITTSEGQSYAMLRAFWLRDKVTFDKVYKWSKDNLQIPRGDHLFSWKWGQRADLTWGALDKTSASDADQDIALALLLAYREWKDPVYLEDARLILNDIWERLTVNLPIGRVLLPGDWPQKGREYQINPSYFSPYAYRVFTEMDPDHDWTVLIDSSYEILARAIAQTETHLPPDWVMLSADNDEVGLYQEAADDRSDFGYEAIRIYWRVGMDSLLNPLEKRATSFLKTRNMLPRYWKIRKDVPISITWDGIVRHQELRSGAVYGAVLPSLYVQDRSLAQEVVVKKILPNLKAGGQWNTRNDYYSQNWLWCGYAIYGLYQDTPGYSRGSALNRLATLMRIDQ
jgi:endoglucanase